MEINNNSAASLETTNYEIKSFFDSAPQLRDGISVSTKLNEFIGRNSSSLGKSMFNQSMNTSRPNFTVWHH